MSNTSIPDPAHVRRELSETVRTTLRGMQKGGQITGFDIRLPRNLKQRTVDVNIFVSGRTRRLSAGGMKCETPEDIKSTVEGLVRSG